MKKTWNIIMFGLIKRIFLGLLTGLVKESIHTKCVLLSNQKVRVQPTLINLHPNEYIQELHHCPFAVRLELDRCAGSCNTINSLTNKAWVPNNPEESNLSVFNMIIATTESKALTKHISCECICRFDGRKCNSDQWWNNNKCRYDC